MPRLSILFLVVLTATVAFACGSASTPTASPEGPASPESAATESAATEGDVCPVVDPGPPAVCPEGCAWNGSECRKHSGIIMPNARDGGSN
jgi:hypothetical protein